ncbi:hypothetical protein PT300_06285 [Enterobacteriaceae bacterium ESL0689]|nr:hypothetical protein [Enterobacteriaceae bacterium ESL0689]
MKLTEEVLLASGFSPRKLQIIKNHNAGFDETFDDAIRGFAEGFRGMLWGLTGCAALFICVCFSKDQSNIVATGIALLIVIPFAVFIHPPVLSYKSRRYWRIH